MGFVLACLIALGMFALGLVAAGVGSAIADPREFKGTPVHLDPPVWAVFGVPALGVAGWAFWRPNDWLALAVIAGASCVAGAVGTRLDWARMPRERKERLLREAEEHRTPAERGGEAGPEIPAPPPPRPSTERSKLKWPRGRPDIPRPEAGGNVKALVRALVHGEDAGARTEAVRALCELDYAKNDRLEKALVAAFRHPRAAEHFVRALREAHVGRPIQVSPAIIKAIGRSGNPQAVEPLLDLLEYVRTTKPMRKALRKSLYDAIVQALGVIGASAVEPLVAAATDSRTTVRRVAVQALGATRDSRAVEPLLAALEDRDDEVRRLAIEALGNIGDTRSVEPLIECLTRGSPRLAEAAARALGRIGCDRSREALASFLTSDAPKPAPVRRAVVAALGHLGDPGPAEALLAALEDQEPTVRSAACTALGAIFRARGKGREEYSKALNSDPDRFLLQRRVISEIKHRLHDGEATVRAAASTALGQVGFSSDSEELCFLIQGETDPSVLARAARALGMLGEPLARTWLLALLGNTDPSVRWAAYEALLLLGQGELLEEKLTPEQLMALLSHTRS